ncbi:site-specific integrase [Ruminiclostridium herbifermentans]|uniref:Site-specific integrase n=1 Tax=Ruminiclostridium herbifermentans TaxID=2488810 RepID=A0A4U7J6G0_9FIRM|nr:site-specific integrase [Ruminiclostridium herbifermentans]QNU66945.1 site-specific integrase [Ruminiclostridium herbifermentans]
MAGNIEVLGNGRYRLRASIGTGKNRKVFRKNIRCETPMKDDGKFPREVELELAKFVAAVSENKVSRSNMTFRQFTETVWLPDYAERKLKTKTLVRYKEMLDSRIYDALGHIRISKLSPTHLNKFYKQLEEPIEKKSKTGEIITENLSARTIEHHHDLISSILGKAVKWDYIVSNPAQKADPPKVEESERPFLEEDEIKKVMDALSKEPLKYQSMILLDLFSGLRRGELMGLNWTDIDFINNTITINKTSNYTTDTGIYEDTVKTKKSNRTISMPVFVMSILRGYYSEQKKYKDKKREKGKLLFENDKLFIQHNGKPMHPDTPTKWWPKFLEKNNLPHVNFHGLRHTNASIMTALGFDIVTGSGRLGHARKDTFLNTYSHMLTTKEKGVAAAMDKEFNPHPKQRKVYRLKKI